MRKAIVAVAVVVAGCSASAGGSGARTSDIREFVKPLHCASVEDANEILVREAVDCDLPGGDSVRVLTFNDGHAEDQYLTAAKALGGGVYVVGDGWAVQTQSVQ